MNDIGLKYLRAYLSADKDIQAIVRRAVESSEEGFSDEVDYKEFLETLQELLFPKE